jgi:predicted ATP-binding protein involved in virulence
MRIEKIHIKKVTVFDDDSIDFPLRKTNPELAEIHIFTGKNGSGKSTLIKSLAAGFNHSKDYNGSCVFTNNNHSYSMEKSEDSFINTTTDICKETPIVVTKCTSGQEHFHINPNCKQLEQYFIQMSENWDSNYEFDFAFFAYGGNRIIPFNPNSSFYNFNTFMKESVLSQSEAMRKNPLFQSLEFEKSVLPNNGYNLHDWVKEMIYQSKFIDSKDIVEAKTAAKCKLFLDKVQNFLSDIMEVNFEFRLQASTLDKVKIVFDNKHYFDFELMANGVKSLVSWVVDLCYRLTKLKWKNDLSLFERNFILFLDEIDTHLHISWQRKILPFLQELFPKAQIFIATHSPFVVNSIDGAWIHKLQLDKETWTVDIGEAIESRTDQTYKSILKEIFESENEFSKKVEDDLDPFYEAIKANKLPNTQIIKKGIELIEKYKDNDLIKNRVGFEIDQLSK